MVSFHFQKPSQGEQIAANMKKRFIQQKSQFLPHVQEAARHAGQKPEDPAENQAGRNSFRNRENGLRCGSAGVGMAHQRLENADHLLGRFGPAFYQQRAMPGPETVALQECVDLRLQPDRQ